MLAGDLGLEPRQLLLLEELELVTLGGNQGSHAPQALPQLRDPQGELLELLRLELHLYLRLARELVVAGHGVEEEGPGLLPYGDAVRRALVEGDQVGEDGVEADLAEVLVPAADHARPELLLETLIVLRVALLTGLVIDGLLLEERALPLLALLPGAVAVAVL